MTRRESGQIGRRRCDGSASRSSRAREVLRARSTAFEDKVDLKNFDPVLFSQPLYESAPLRLTFRARDRKQAEAWQKKLHAKLVELLGGFPGVVAHRSMRRRWKCASFRATGARSSYSKAARARRCWAIC